MYLGIISPYANRTKVQQDLHMLHVTWTFTVAGWEELQKFTTLTLAYKSLIWIQIDIIINWKAFSMFSYLFHWTMILCTEKTCLHRCRSKLSSSAPPATKKTWTWTPATCKNPQQGHVTLPKFNIAPEKLPSQKVSSLPTTIVQGLC